MAATRHWGHFQTRSGWLLRAMFLSLQGIPNNQALCRITMVHSVRRKYFHVFMVHGLTQGKSWLWGQVGGTQVRASLFNTSDLLFFLTPVGGDLEKTQIYWQSGESILKNQFHLSDNQVTPCPPCGLILPWFWECLPPRSPTTSAEAFCILKTVSHLVRCEPPG